jgi:hypothetical protein
MGRLWTRSIKRDGVDELNATLFAALVEWPRRVLPSATLCFEDVVSIPDVPVEGSFGDASLDGERFDATAVGIYEGGAAGGISQSLEGEAIRPLLV